jgi:hypothetical protein
MEEAQTPAQEGNTFTKIRQWLPIIAFVLGSLAIAWAIMSYAEAFSSFAVALVLADVVMIKLWLIDKFLLRGYDTITEIKAGNVAAALILVAYSIVVLGAVIAAFVIWVPKPGIG